MMMIHRSSHPSVHIPIPPWPPTDPDPYAEAAEEEEEEEEEESEDLAVDQYSSDEFRMYEFKIRMCVRGRSHDWTDCPYAHPGEKARRRDPRKYHYSGTPCPEFKKGSCRKGEGCEYAHGVFECWLHPTRYRTQPCKDGTACRRRVCFFAHTPEQLRVLSPRSTLGFMKVVDSYDGSPMRLLSASASASSSSSPPMSPMGSEYGSMSPPVSPDGLALWLHRKMRLGGAAPRMGGTSVPTTPRRREREPFVDHRPPLEEEQGGGGGEEGPDFGWVSELVK